MDGFQVVQRKTHHKKKHRKPQTTMRSRLEDIRLEIQSTEFFKETFALLKNCFEEMKPKADQIETGSPGSQLEIEMVCYGLGNFADSYIARYQLSFFMALREELKVSAERCSLYDPQFTGEEADHLREQNMTVLEVNEEGKRACSDGKITVFYMPHCGKALYNNLLWSNWGDRLHNVVVIGNSFTRMVESTPERLLSKTANYVLKIHPYTMECPLPSCTQYDDVFNDTSIHSFRSFTLETVPSDLWKDSQEPVYDEADAEIICR